MTAENLAIPYHQQDTDYYCGAACAQMVLDSMAAGLQNQDLLYTDARNHTAELASWFNPPDGLQWLMNDRRPAGFAGWFALFSLDAEDALSRKLIWTLHHHRSAPIALVFGGDHWVVVRGYDATAAPATADDVTYAINAFDINSPWPPVPSFSAPPTTPPPAPPPHGATDGCGTGGMRGVANEHISYPTWQSSYMTANKYGANWLGKFVAVCDPDPPADQPGRIAPRPQRRGGEDLLAPQLAAGHASDGAKRYGLHERENWALALRDTTPKTPMLVQRLDAVDSYYYIVPFEDARGVRAAVSVNARTGDYRQSIMVDRGETGILTGLDDERIRKLTIGRVLDLPNRQGRLHIRREAFSLSPTLVWRPCLESLSPFYPFHVITIGAHRVYVRVDGRIFTELHTEIPGV